MTAALIVLATLPLPGIVAAFELQNRKRRRRVVPGLTEDAELMNKRFLHHAAADLLAHPEQHGQLW
jgi:hypothetical protein